MISSKISIIIPAYNCEKTIESVIVATQAAVSAFLNTPELNATPRCAQIIVVDDGSTDQTKDKILKFPTVKYVFQKNAGPAFARNSGAKEASGDILFFTDSDCLPHGDWINKMMPHFCKPSVAVVAGSYGIANPNSRLSRAIFAEILFRHRVLMPEFPCYFGSFNFAIEKSVFEKVGGFDASYSSASGEDNDLSYKISSSGHKIYFAKDALVDHYHPESLRKYLAQQYNHGFWRARMYRDHPRMAQGDGYTFWKDSVEVFLVLVIYFSIVLIFLGFFNFAAGSFAAAALSLVLMNIFFGKKIIVNWRDGLFFSDVMILRAFSRTNGFLSGLWAERFFSPRGILNFSKIFLQKN